jgi:hypothetical protein
MELKVKGLDVIYKLAVLGFKPSILRTGCALAVAAVTLRQQTSVGYEA